jgi:hypothetical protein
MLSIGVDSRGDSRLSSREQQAFSTENESPFAEFKPSLKQTGIFIDRFFHAFSYSDLAKKYDMSVNTARKTYHNSIKRVLSVIHAMDSGEIPSKQVDFWKKKVEQRSGSLPKGQR